MNGKDEIKELFSEKLGNFEAKVNPELWGNIASQIGVAGTATTGTALSLTAKWLIGVGVASVITVGTVIAVNQSGGEDEKSTVVATENSSVSEQQEITPEESENFQDDLVQINDNQEVNALSIEDNNPIQDAEFRGGDVENGPIQDASQSEDRVEVDGNSPRNGADEHQENHQNKEAVTDNGSQSGDDVRDAQNEDKNDTKEDLTTEGPLSDEINEPVELEFNVNVFTPNNDGINDELFIKNQPETEISGFVFVVLDSRSQRVFESTDINFRWDATDFTGEPVPDGKYVYIVTGRDANGNSIKQYQTLEIVR